MLDIRALREKIIIRELIFNKFTKIKINDIARIQMNWNQGKMNYWNNFKEM